MADKQLVLAFFADELSADTAATTLKNSEIVVGDAIGILVLDADGKLVVDKVGATSIAAGVGVGACLLVLGPAMLGVGLGAAIVGGGIGAAGGAAAGSLHHKGLKLSAEDKARISAELSSGKAAVGVLAEISEGAAVRERLTALGGSASAHDVVDEAALKSAVSEG
ncbi:MAG TPA: hypothetical protein VIJ15_07740 [Dermatophilaceae bacterium]